jgi:tRNA nucleotidyltransferase (CCA-adding enzyme)
MDRPDLLEALGRLPGGETLLRLAPAGAYLVGGAVRDLLLERTPRELDVVLAGAERGALLPSIREVAQLAGELASRLRTLAGVDGEGISEHERFGTAIVEWDGGRIDIAAARREHYANPGALPEVQPAPLPDDLRRRDFTINAIALTLNGPEQGRLQAATHALDDLRGSQLRVLHERSFLDDPTRLWRLARYRARLGFEIEQGTAELAAAAVAGGALATVSGARLGTELRLALAEADPLTVLSQLDELGLLGALHPRLRFERELSDRALALLASDRSRHAAGRSSGQGSESRGVEGASAGERRAEPEDRPDLLLLAALALPLALRADGQPRSEIAALLERLEFAGGERGRVADAAVAVPALIDALARDASPSQLRAVALRVPPEGVALAGAMNDAAQASARRWLGELRGVRPRIGGEDLLAAGVPQGPEIGRRLEEILRLRLDGELPDEREAQLRAALALQ